MLKDFNVTRQSTKVGIDGNGVIVYRAGIGQGDTNEWHGVLTGLAAAN